PKCRLARAACRARCPASLSRRSSLRLGFERAAAVAAAKADERHVDAAPERDRLEELAHLRGTEKLLHRGCGLGIADGVVDRNAREELEDAAVDEEAR